MIGTSAWLKPTQPASVSSAISVSTSPARPRVSGTQREQPAQAELAGAELQHLHQAGLVQRGVGVGRADQAGDTTRSGGVQLALEHALMLMPRLAQAGGQVDQAGRDDAAGRVDHALGLEIGPAPRRW